VKYRKKALLIEATQWLKHGDHPQVENFRALEDEWGNPYCPICGNLMQRHGLLDEEVVCPGDYIITDRNGYFSRLSRGEFESHYEPYVRVPSYAKQPLSDLEQRKQSRKRREESV